MMDVSQKQIAARPVITPTYKHLRMGVIVGGRVVEELKFLPGKAVTIGTLPGNDIQIADSAHAPLSLALFHYESGDRCQIHLNKGMTARISTQGEIQEIEVQTEDKVLSLDSSADRGKIVLDDITLIFQFVDRPERPESQPKPPPKKRISRGFIRRILFGPDADYLPTCL
ncbi:MAG: hypothetical protein ACYC44_00440 [Patescibacteria group bacterium]